MKKLMILAVLATLALGSSSCKKSGTCECKTGGVVISSTPNTSKTDCDAIENASLGVLDCSIK